MNERDLPDEYYQQSPAPSGDTSPAIGELAAALAKAQGAIKGAAKDSLNPHFRSRYADLASIWDACRDALSNNGLAVVQLPRFDGQRVHVDTLLMHASGQWIRGSMSASPVKADVQGIAGCVTYLRRYSLAAIAGVAPDDDDDGEVAVGRAPQREVAQPAPQPARAEAKKTRRKTEDSDDEITTRAQPWIKRMAATKSKPDLLAVARELDEKVHPNDPVRDAIRPHYEAECERLANGAA